MAVIVLVAAAGIYQFIDPQGWIRFTFDVVGLPQYQSAVQGLTPAQLQQDFGWLFLDPVRVGSVLISPFEFVDLLLVGLALVVDRLVRGRRAGHRHPGRDRRPPRPARVPHPDQPRRRGHRPAARPASGADRVAATARPRGPPRHRRRGARRPLPDRHAHHRRRRRRGVVAVPTSRSSWTGLTLPPPGAAWAAVSAPRRAWGRASACSSPSSATTPYLQVGNELGVRDDGGVHRAADRDPARALRAAYRTPRLGRLAAASGRPASV